MGNNLNERNLGKCDYGFRILKNTFGSWVVMQPGNGVCFPEEWRTRDSEALSDKILEHAVICKHAEVGFLGRIKPHEIRCLPKHNFNYTREECESLRINIKCCTFDFNGAPHSITVNSEEDAYAIARIAKLMIRPEISDINKWKEFQTTGLLWFVNQFLHVFGYAITYKYNEDKEIISVCPEKVSFRGFTEESNEKGYKNVTKYVKGNIDKLYIDVNGDYD